MVADDAGYAAFIIKQPGRAVRRVALAGYPFVPVVEGMGGVLFFDFFEPGMLTERLIKVAVDADVPFDSLAPSELGIVS